jgi:DNA polymerase-1
MVINGMPFNEEGHKKFMANAWKERTAALAVLTDTFGTNRKGGEINWRSPKQVKEAFEDIGHVIPNTRKETFIKLTYKGGPLGELAQLKLNFSLPDQSVKTYHDEWVSKYVEVDGRVHFKFWQCGADTTRFTSSSPNGQQIPRKMRGSFGNVPGHKIVSNDYAQIEVRIAADIANDQRLIDALAAEDVHTAIAAESFGVPYEEITSEMRRDGKGGTFTLLFGGGARTLYEYNLVNGSKASFNDAQMQVRNFFNRFTGLKRLREQARKQAQRKNAVIVRLPTGHRRILAGWQKRPQTILNTMIQGTAAAGMKLGMIEAHKRGLFKYIGAQFHDELDSTVPEAEAEEFAAEVVDSMVQGMTTVVEDVPVYVDTTISDLWEK